MLWVPLNGITLPPHNADRVILRKTLDRRIRGLSYWPATPMIPLGRPPWVTPRWGPTPRGGPPHPGPHDAHRLYGRRRRSEGALHRTDGGGGRLEIDGISSDLPESRASPRDQLAYVGRLLRPTSRSVGVTGVSPVRCCLPSRSCPPPPSRDSPSPRTTDYLAFPRCRGVRGVSPPIAFG